MRKRNVTVDLVIRKLLYRTGIFECIQKHLLCEEYTAANGLETTALLNQIFI